MVSWDDVLFGVLTGGAYNAVKAAAQAGDAAGKVGDDIGKSVAITTEKALSFLDEITGFVTGLEQLMVIKRLTARNENDLWDEDKERLAALRNLEAICEAAYKQKGGADTYTNTLTQSIVDWMMGRGSSLMGQYAVQILTLRKAIDDILYNEPGVIPETIYQVKAVIERFHTLEQPRIETLMDTTTDTIQEGNEILIEVKKLFIIRKYNKRSFTNLSADEKSRHTQLSARMAHFDGLIQKNAVLADSLQNGLASVRISGTVLPGGALKPGILSATSPAGLPAEPGPAHVVLPFTGAYVSPGILANINGQVNNSQVVALLGASNTIQGRLLFYERERLKVEKSLFKLNNELIEVPGVIPNTLDEVYLSIQRFRTEEQPRIEKIMDSGNETIRETTVVLKSVDLTVLESRKLLAHINLNLQKTQGWFDFFSKYRIPLLVGCGCVAVLVFAIMVMVFVVLVKMAFF